MYSHKEQRYIEIYLAIIVLNWGLKFSLYTAKSKQFISFLIALQRIFKVDDYLRKKLVNRP